MVTTLLEYSISEAAKNIQAYLKVRNHRSNSAAVRASVSQSVTWAQLPGPIIPKTVKTIFTKFFATLCILAQNFMVIGNILKENVSKFEF